MKSKTLIVAALLLLVGACTKHDPLDEIGKKLEAAAAELPQVNEVRERQLKLRADNNGWDEMLAANAVVDAFESDNWSIAGDFRKLSWFDASTNKDDSSRKDPETLARAGLTGTEAFATHLAAAAEHERIVPWDSSSPDFALLVIPTFPLILPFSWGVSRFVAHEIVGDSDSAKAELLTLFKAADRVVMPPTLISANLLKYSIHQTVLRALLHYAGKPGWDRSVVSGMLDTLRPYEPRYAQIFAGELAYLREAFLPVGDEPDDDDGDTELPFVLEVRRYARNFEAETALMIDAYSAVIRADAEQPLQLMVDRDLRRVLELLQPLFDFPDDDRLITSGVRDSTLRVVTGLTELRMLRAAVELRLLESENGPLTGQREAVRNVVADIPGVTFKFREGTLALVPDKTSWRYNEGSIPKPMEITLEPRT
jgi:hypothetical protein